MTKVRFEVCIDSIEAARTATEAGADRVELCAGLLEGGTTPSHGIQVRAQEVCGLPIVVLIRPRGGDFLYTEEEHAAMLLDIEYARSLDMAGIAIGALLPDSRVDVERCRQYVDRARPMSLTFHRAFDQIAEPFEALETLIELGFDRVLSSGQAADALAGADRLRALRERAADRITILAGGGIRPHNVGEIIRLSGVSEVHASAMGVHASGMRVWNDALRLTAAACPPETERRVTRAEAIRAMLTALAEGHSQA